VSAGSRDLRFAQGVCGFHVIPFGRRWRLFPYLVR
jgi:hypothetical protein